jgi:hypothetical protein
MPMPRLARQRSAPLPAPDDLLSDDGLATPGRRRRLRWAALATIALAVAATGAVLGIDSGGRGPSSNGQGVPPGDTTAAVERRTLTEHAQLNGTLTYSGSSEIYDRLAGTFTWLPAAGALIHRGQQLFRIDNEPVVLMYGSLPAYRALEEGVSAGPDVAELNENLIALGYDPDGAIGTRDHFGAATAAAVRRWQSAEGLPETGRVELGRVVFAAGERRVSSVHVSLGEDPPAASEEALAKRKQEEQRAAQRRHEEAADKSRREAAKRRLQAAREKAEARRRHSSKPASHDESAKHGDENAKSANHGNENAAKHNEGNGNGKEKEGSDSPAAAQPQLALSTSGRRQIVQLQVKADQQQLAHVGERTQVTLPDGSVVSGHIITVGTVATESSENEHGGGGGGGGGGNGENATVAVTLALDRAVSHLDKAPVSVELVKSVRHDVLAVPATALIAVSGGGYALAVLEGNRRVQIPVTTGMFAGGYVEVEGAGVREGLTVLVPQ